MGAAFAYAQKYCPEEVNNHVARCGYWALILAKKLPGYIYNNSVTTRPVNVNDVVLICLLHDLGLASWLFDSDDPASAASNPLPGLLTLDKRFEVDGANIARAFVQAEMKTTTDSEPWDDARLDRLWAAIALHTIPSVARHAPAPEITLAQMAVEADIAGLNWSPGFGGPVAAAPPGVPAAAVPTPLITVDEFRAVTALFPRHDFDREGFKRNMCGMCRRKPETTYDDLIGLFGKVYGLGYGKGSDDGQHEEFVRAWEARQSPEFLLQALDQSTSLGAAK